MRAILLIMLPLLAVCDITNEQREKMKEAERLYGPCVLEGTGCPDNSFTYEKIVNEVTKFKLNHPSLVPSECLCEESERCNRVCYLAIVKRFYAGAIAPPSSKRSSGKVTDEQREKMKEAERLYGPCVLEGTGCPDNSFTYERILSEVTRFKANNPTLVPSECQCEESERCNRVCYLAIVKRLIAGVIIPPSSK